MEAAAARRETVRALKREVILDAAKAVFAEKGLEGASMRAIAAASGYTAGALYSYFPDKEHIYAEVLEGELRALIAHMRAEIATARSAETRLDRAVLSFYGYYRRNPQALELGFYLFQGVRPRGLTPALDRRLNGLLIKALEMIATALREARGGSEADIERDTVATLAHASGVLLLENTGRMRTLGQSGDGLMRAWLSVLRPG
jgi:AcrR family transcriptional regulator